jgi:hypothetical protein
MVYRSYPSDTKIDFVSLENIELDYENKKSVTKNEKKLNESIIVDSILKNIEKEYELHEEIIKKQKISQKVLPKIAEKYSYAVIGTVLDKLNKDKLYIFMKSIMIKYFKKDDSVNPIINYLHFENKLINYYEDVMYDKSKIKDNVFVGFIINNNCYAIENIEKIKIKSIDYNKINFIQCSRDLYSQIKERKNKPNVENKKFNVIYGILEYNKKKDTNVFKIIDKTSEEVVLTKDKKTSKRSIYTGRTCSTFHFDKILELRDKVGMYKLNGKRKIDFVCEDLEIYFRYMNLLKEDGKYWFDKIKN